MFYKIVVTILYPIFMLLYRVHIVGKENIPKGASLLAANHSSLLDPVLIAVGLTAKNKLNFMSKKELFKNRLFGALISSLGAFPVDRNSADIATIRKSIDVLKSGGKLLIFPEGRRVLDGNIDAEGAKSGVAMIALRANVPIVPIYLSANKKIFRKTVLSIGKPIIPEKKEGSSADNYKRISTDIFAAITAMEAECCENS